MKHINEVAKRYAILALSGFVDTLAGAGVNNSKKFNKWKKSAENAKYMATAFEYPRHSVSPSITELIKPFYHPTLPLVGLGSTELERNLPEPSPAIRLCRGIVFDYVLSDLVSMPFIKLVDSGEINPADETFQKLVQPNSHLRIIFRYGDNFIIADRDNFDTPNLQLANKSLALHARNNNWLGKFGLGLTVLVRIIGQDDDTDVNYSDEKECQVISAFHSESSPMVNLSYEHLLVMGSYLKLPVTDILQNLSPVEAHNLRARIYENL